MRTISNIFRGGWITCTKQYVETLPIRTINFSDPTDLQHHDQMVAHVEHMLSLHQQLAKALTPTGKTHSSADQIHRRPFDALVYELYGLTEEEIRVVEGR